MFRERGIRITRPSRTRSSSCARPSSARGRSRTRNAVRSKWPRAPAKARGGHRRTRFFHARQPEAVDGLLQGTEAEARRAASRRKEPPPRSIGKAARRHLGHPHRHPRRPHGERLAHPALHRSKAKSSSWRARYRHQAGELAFRHVRRRVHAPGRALLVRGVLARFEITTPRCGRSRRSSTTSISRTRSTPSRQCRFEH